MARPLRIEYPGACYHVLSRGNQRQKIFKQTGDYKLFLDKVERYSVEYQIELYSYCLMSNHFHFFLKTQEANLSRFMQALQTSFSMNVNRRNGGSGHIFQGRFKSILVEKSRYRKELSRYIHLNPVQIRGFKRKPVKAKRDYLKRYRWSSYRAVIGLEKKPAFLNRRYVLLPWGKTVSEQMKNYRSYVEQGLIKKLDDPFEHVVAQSILGCESFVEQIKRRYLLHRDADEREQPALVYLQQSYSASDIISIVAEEFGVTEQLLLSRQSTEMMARKIAMYCVCHYCRSAKTLTTLAPIFSVSLSGLTRGRDRAHRHIQESSELQHLLRKINTRIRSESNA